jgi:nicotinamidase-related amidase
MKQEIFGKKNLLLIIDAQRDFCEHDGSLYVLGATEALKNLCKFIDVNRVNISEVLLTQDSHGYCNICHPAAWHDKSGHILDPYTTVTSESVEKGIYTPRFVSKEYILDYLKKIELKGGTHTIWPVHCLDGSHGAAFPDDLVISLKHWSEKLGGKNWKIVKKGQRNEAEMYSVFSYADGSKPELGDLLGNIAEQNFDKILVAGFAKDICVAYSVQDLMTDDRFKDKLVFLDSCMATLNSKSTMLKVYDEAIQNFGAKTITI